MGQKKKARRTSVTNVIWKKIVCHFHAWKKLFLYFRFMKSFGGSFVENRPKHRVIQVLMIPQLVI